MSRQMWAIVLVVSLSSFGTVFGEPATQGARLLELSRSFTERLEAQRPQLYYDLRAGRDAAQRQLNDDRDLELMRINDRGLPVFYETHNINAAGTISTDDVWPGGSGGFAMTGLETVLGRLCVWDGGGVRLTHQEFGGRVVQMDSPGATSYHSTHVAGTLVATGVSANAQGMSYMATLAAYEWGSDEAEMAAAAAAGANVSSHSYGTATGWRRSGDWYWYGDPGVSETEDYKFGFYDSQARDWDEIAYNAPYYTIAKSAGNDRNDFGPTPGDSHYVWIGGWVWSTTARDWDGGTDGYDCISTKGVAKNIITVGAINDIPGGYTTPASVIMSTFSGWGPTDDGRLKPDIVANGVSLYSCDDDHDADYTTLSGTSMSTPNAAGSINLLVRYYEATHTGETPLASTVKAIVIQTADEAGPDPGPDYMNGWGLMNTLTAAQLVATDSVQPGHLVEDSLQSGTEALYTFSSSGEEPFRLTLAWTDPAATPPSLSLNPTTRMLVHDLDVEVWHEASGTTYSPYVLDPVTPSAPAGTGDNILDNVEQVYIAAPPVGDYYVTVSHKDALTANQYFSLASAAALTGYQCPVETTGDIDVDAVVNAADVVAMVAYVFRSGPAPLPCEASADANCDGVVNAADIIDLVIYVFQSGAPPCDVCTMVPGTWGCF